MMSFQYIFLNTHTNTLLTDRQASRVYKYTSPDLANRGYYNLVSELWLTDSGEGTYVQMLRRTARLSGWSVMYYLLYYCLIALIMMIELLSD